MNVAVTPFSIFQVLIVLFKAVQSGDDNKNSYGGLYLFCADRSEDKEDSGGG